VGAPAPRRGRRLCRGRGGPPDRFARRVRGKLRAGQHASNQRPLRLHRSSVPVLAIAAQVPSRELGSNYFHETRPDILFKDCSHYCESISNAAQMPRVFGLAIQAAIGHRGVAVVSVPGEVALLEAPISPCTHLYTPTPRERVRRVSDCGGTNIQPIRCKIPYSPPQLPEDFFHRLFTRGLCKWDRHPVGKKRNQRTVANSFFLLHFLPLRRNPPAFLLRPRGGGWPRTAFRP